MSSKAVALRTLLASTPIVRIVGAHNALGAKLIERNGFDGVWASGLEISTAHAVPDANILTMTENLAAAQMMNDATRLPIVCDCDTGYGNASNVMHMVKKYEMAGLAAVVIEDKRFPKVNSFVPGRQELVSVEEFVGKIEAAKAAQRSTDFLVFTRLEALIAGWGLDEALRRAYAYAEAGSDGLVIHSKASTPDEVFAFAKRWKGSIPLVVIPTTYYGVTTKELASRGFRMVIYANHGLRAAIRAMDDTFRTIAQTGSTAAVEPQIASLRQVFELQGMTVMVEEEKRFLRRERLQVVIAAAGDNRLQQPDLQELLADRPLCMLEIGGETLLERQMNLLRSAGATEFYVIGGYQYDKIRAEGATLVHNPNYATSHSAHSVMLAKDALQGRCLVTYSDILFDRQIVDRLLDSPHAITLVIDRAYQTLPFREKRLDLVVAEDPARGATSRRLQLSAFKPVRQIGKQVNRDDAGYEFIGMVLFREEGLRELKRAWEEALRQGGGRAFYEAPSVEQASVTDVLQYLIDRGVPVFGMEVEHGWSEIHSRDDYERLNAYFQQPEGAASKAS